jgi:LPPG:FO 2-phospho-L-lactate transferase
MILALAGGVGGARMSAGLAQVLAPDELAIAVNTGDDFEHLGLSICPDLDSVMYTLAGRHNHELGWGQQGETWRCMQALEAIGGETWFRLGDLDLATHLHRSSRLRQGAALSEVTGALCTSFGVKHRIVPMSEQPVRTRVLTDEGELAFQEYFVRRRQAPRFKGTRFDGADKARPSEGFVAALQDERLQAIVICPSNPFLSIAPLLSLPGIESALRARHVPSVAISPIVGGAAVKGPLAKMMQELGEEVSPVGIARRYAGLIDGLVIDDADSAFVPEIESLGLAVKVAPTMMTTPDRQRELALRVISFARTIHAAAS